jgi:valyl-tRNA synthetase
LEIIKLIDDKNSVKVGLIIFKYFLRLLHPFTPFLASFLYDKLYSESILFSERDGKLLKKLVENLEVDSLERTGKSSVIRRNNAVMSLFYQLLRKIREFKNKYSLEKEDLIFFLVLLPMKRVGDNRVTYLTDDESYKGID